MTEQDELSEHEQMLLQLADVNFDEIQVLRLIKR